MGRTPLHVAAESRSLNATQALLAAEGIDVNAMDLLVRTPLNFAGVGGVAEALLVAGAHRTQVPGASVRFDLAQDMFAQAFNELYIPEEKRLRILGRVTFVNGGQAQEGHDAGGLRRDFVSRLAEGLRGRVLKDVYEDTTWRLLPVRFYDGGQGRFNEVPPSDDEDKLRFFGAVLAQFFLLDETAKSNFLPFALDVQIYRALAEGSVSKPEGKAGKPSEPKGEGRALGDCESVAALLGDPENALGRLGPYNRSQEDYNNGGKTEWGHLAPNGTKETDDVDFEQLGDVLGEACARFWANAWEKPMNLVLEGWEAQFANPRSGLQFNKTLEEFATFLRAQTERPGKVDLGSLAGALSVQGGLAGLPEDQVKRTFMDALNHIREESGEDRLRSFLRFWTGSPHVDTTETYVLQMIHQESGFVVAHTCGFQADIPVGLFRAGREPKLVETLLKSVALSGTGFERI
uniref:Uncharacterized protein n=1 Tax=Zooxanthella nutricula TaxID=1333877 RepID=A0A6U6QKQ5_9DINO